MKLGISDKGFHRLAQGMDEHNEIKELQQGVSQVGLYYDHSVMEQTLASNFEDPENWVIIQTPGKYGMPLVDKVNFEIIVREMEAVGTEDKLLSTAEIAFRVGENGELNASGMVLKEIVAALSNYPVLDDSKLSQVVYDMAIESIEENSWNLVDESKIPGGWEKEVWDHIWNSAEQEVLSVSDDGTFVDVPEYVIEEALRDLGWLLKEEE